VSSREVSASRFPYLQNVSADGASVIWTTGRPGVGVVRYSSDDSLNHWAVSKVRELLPSETQFDARVYEHRVRLTDLRAGTRYRYQVFVEDEDITGSDRLFFRTAGLAFAFLAFGDSGSGAFEQKLLAADGPGRSDLVVHTGTSAYMHGSFLDFETNHFAVYRLAEDDALFPVARESRVLEHGCTSLSDGARDAGGGSAGNRPGPVLFLRLEQCPFCCLGHQ
jgi:hypothetical protein